VLCSVALCLQAQSSKDGSFKGKTYTDRYFDITLDIPATLQPKTQAQTNLNAPESTDAWMMFSAQQGAKPYGIVMITQLLQPEGKGIFSAADFLRRVRNTRQAGDSLGANQHQVSSHGLTFDWVDWKSATGEFDSAIITQRGHYLLVARCSAKSESELQTMKNAIFDIRVIGK
jgi:hypothetical protein